ncbi:MAG: proprotein convertase P-domain-containing protein, partial [Pyrinomonadaceae bacterium]
MKLKGDIMKELSVGSYQKIRLLYASLMFFSIAAAALWFGTDSTSVAAKIDKTTEAAAPLATFPGTGAGAIPDSPGGTPPVYGTPLVISYAVTGISAPLTDVSVNLTATHSWVGDLDVVLRSPSGTAQQTIFSRVGALTATSFGSSSDLSGLYNFTDTATGTNFWTAAAATPIP